MQSFRKFDRTTTLMLGLLVIAFLLATFDVRSAGGGVGTTMRDGVQTLFAPLQDAASSVTRPVVGFIDAISDIASLRDENEALRLENEGLQLQVQQYASLQAELDHLMEINDLEVAGNLPTVVARIESPGSSSFDLVRYIDKGSEHGISLGDAVVDEQGLVGRVDMVFDNRARVRLIVDPNVTVSVRDETTNQTGLTTGDNDGLVLRIFGAEEPVREGNVVVTAGSRFPPDIVVGTVLNTAADDAGFGLVTDIAPAVNFTRLDYVKVIVGFSPLDRESEEEEPAAEEVAEEAPEEQFPPGEESATTTTVGETP
jgi:rod shape-determining protein MreC